MKTATNSASRIIVATQYRSNCICKQQVSKHLKALELRAKILGIQREAKKESRNGRKACQIYLERNSKGRRTASSSCSRSQTTSANKQILGLLSCRPSSSIDVPCITDSQRNLHGDRKPGRKGSVHWNYVLRIKLEKQVLNYIPHQRQRVFTLIVMAITENSSLTAWQPHSSW